jgi:hypothetical protein
MVSGVDRTLSVERRTPSKFEIPNSTNGLGHKYGIRNRCVPWFHFGRLKFPIVMSDEKSYILEKN